MKVSGITRIDRDGIGSRSNVARVLQQHMRQTQSILVAMVIAVTLAACGSDGGGDANVGGVTPFPTITGLAATGAAIANTAVTANCAAGPSVSGTTGADGAFTLELSGGQALPCMVQVKSTVPLSLIHI